jgi:hypothetical protein
MTQINSSAIARAATARGWAVEPSPADLLALRLYNTDRQVVGNISLAPAPWADSDDARSLLNRIGL